MRLSLLARVFDTVDQTTRTSPISDRIAECWTEAKGKVTEGRGSETFAFRVDDAQDSPTHYLRFSHESERPLERVHAEIQFIRNLIARGIPATKPVRSKLGHFTESVETSLGVFHANLFTTIPGEELEVSGMNEKQLSSLGGLMARVHDASFGFTGVGRPRWSDLLAEVRATVPVAHTSVHAEVDDLESLLRALPQTKEHFGLVHQDMDNVRFVGNEVSGVYDFDDCHYGGFESDMESVLTTLFGKRAEDFDRTLPGIGAFVRGYASIRSDFRPSYDDYPLFTRLSELVRHSRCVWSLGSVVPVDEQGWASALRNRAEEFLSANRRGLNRSASRRRPLALTEATLLF